MNIPESVTSIGNSAFDFNKNKTIKIKGLSSAPDTWNPKWADNCKAKIVWNA